MEIMMEVSSDRDDNNTAYTEKVLLNCFSSNSDSFTDRLFQDPEAVALLALACKFSKHRLADLAESKQPVK
jgi:hypothetical protein